MIVLYCTLLFVEEGDNLTVGKKSLEPATAAGRLAT